MSLKYYTIIQKVIIGGNTSRSSSRSSKVIYFRSAQKHRKDRPAVIWRGGELTWYQYGRLHNLNGPAYKKLFQQDAYFIHGIEFTAEQHNLVKKYINKA